ncbi:ribonuclease D [Nocardia sp. NPDC004711]
MEKQSTPWTRLYRQDVDENFYRLCQAEEAIAWDIETTGLDWRTDRIATVQVAAGSAVALVQLGGNERPTRLASLLEDQSLLKIFHHAPFDLRFMAYQWRLSPRNVACTKVASKILSPELDSKSHSLMPTLARRLGVRISKEQQQSDWLSTELSAAQLEYAAADVRYLVSLLHNELDEATRQGVDTLIQQSFDYLPCRVTLDILGISDVFAY